VLGNPSYTWLADESGYVSSRAAQKVWQAFGIPDRFGFSIVGGHDHCALPAIQRPEVEAFVDKFLLGIQSADTNVAIHPYPDTDPFRWTGWWGTGVPKFYGEQNAYTVTFEAECGTVGANWLIMEDPEASNGKYVMTSPDVVIGRGVSKDPEAMIVIPFTIPKDGKYDVYLRGNRTDAGSYLFYVKIDSGATLLLGGPATGEWEWRKTNRYTLTAGEHTLTIIYKDLVSILDKIAISDFPLPPSGAGPDADNLCTE
jgi:hypothetical protein